MAKKKTNYEKKGLVRQIAGSIFSSSRDKNQDSKWRPRKTQFARLEGDDDDDFDSRDINRAFSTESDTGDYQREIFFEKKKTVFDRSRTKKRDLSLIEIKPSSRDNTSARKPGNRSKKARKETNSEQKDFFGVDPFSNNAFVRSDDSVDDALSRHTSSSKHTASTKHSAAFNTVRSDPSEFFSKFPAKLTKNNLEAMAMMSAGIARSFSGEGIENVNPRKQFHQFTVDEEKESTVILSVGCDDQDSYYDGDSQSSFGYTSKGTKIQTRPKASEVELFDDSFFASSSRPEEKRNGFVDGFQSFGTNLSGLSKSEGKGTVNGQAKQIRFKRSGGTSGRTGPFSRHQSTHSLVYSDSSTEEGQIKKSAQTFSTGWGSDSDPFRTRTPLSPLNGMERKIPFKKSDTHKIVHQSSDGFENRKFSGVDRPDPDAEWSAFSPTAFERKPDPNGSTAKELRTKKTASKEASASKTNLVRNSRFHKADSRNIQAINGKSLPTREGGMSMKQSEGVHGARRIHQPNRGLRRDGGRYVNKSLPCEQLEDPRQWQHHPSSEFGFETTEQSQLDDVYNNFNNIRRDVWGGRAIPEDRIADIEDDEDNLHDDDDIESVAKSNKPSIGRRPMGIQSFSSAIAHSYSYSTSSANSNSRQHSKKSSRSGSKHERSFHSRGIRSRSSHSEDDDASVGTKQSTSSVSYSKPRGLPNNAIMASMLFQRHHNIDTKVVEEKIKAKEKEYQVDSSRGDIPQAINANPDMYSCVSSFSEDTAAQIDAWRKPTRDLLDHFARSRRTDFDFKSHMRDQRTNATALFEA